MENQKIEKLQNLIIVAKPKLKEKISTLLIENGGHSINTVYGHGSVSKSILAQAFGLEAEQKKVIISCLIKTESAKNLIDILYTEYNFNKPNSGVAFTLPVDGLMF